MARVGIVKIGPAPPPRPLRFSRQNGSYEVSPPAFKDSYVRTLCEKAKLDPAPFAKVTLPVCHAVAVQLLGPVQAVVLAGDAMVALADDQARHDLDERMRTRYHAQPTATPGLYLAPDDAGFMGASTSESVIMPRGFEPILGHPVGDFIVGHEWGHVKKQDVIAGFGRSFLVGQLGEQTKAQTEPLLGQLNREMELQADREGAVFAKSHGHSEKQLLVGVETFFRATGNAEESDSHPGLEARMAAVRSAL